MRAREAGASHRPGIAPVPLRGLLTGQHPESYDPTHLTVRGQQLRDLHLTLQLVPWLPGQFYPSGPGHLFSGAAFLGASCLGSPGLGWGQNPSSSESLDPAVTKMDCGTCPPPRRGPSSGSVDSGCPEDPSSPSDNRPTRGAQPTPLPQQPPRTVTNRQGEQRAAGGLDGTSVFSGHLHLSPLLSHFRTKGT